MHAVGFGDQQILTSGRLSSNLELAEPESLRQTSRARTLTARVGDYAEDEGQLGEAADLDEQEDQLVTSGKPAGPKANSKSNTPVAPTKSKVVGPASRKPQQKTTKKQEKAPKGKQDNYGQAEEANLTALEYSDQVLKRMAAKLPKDISKVLVAQLGETQEPPVVMSMKTFISGTLSKKRKRPTIEDPKKKVAEQNRDVPKNQRKTDQELCTIARIKPRTARYLAAPYCLIDEECCIGVLKVGGPERPGLLLQEEEIKKQNSSEKKLRTSACEDSRMHDERQRR